ncbi:histidine phosphatase family protein [Psychroserpens sp. XS_ASV72]|uniref:SixA phosphatase family protein n=1 Tax=Psychroserpens sp. XS_ASV72 TaxID=3241293 RepID=UPI0035140F35
MKPLLLLAIVFSTFFSVSAQESQTDATTYYFIRHAEKDTSDKSNRNPNLTETGKARAEKWNTVFKTVDFDLVYSTNYNRTLQTAQPTATGQELEIEIYDPRQLNPKDFVENTKGKTVLVVGHGNTTPMFVNAILGESKYQNMAESDNSSLFIVTVVGEYKTDQVLTID